MTLLTTILADHCRNFATARPRTRRRRTLGGSGLLFAWRLLVRSLGKNQGFVFLFGFARRLLRGAAGLTGRDSVDTPVHHRKTLVDGLGVKVIAESILVREFIAKGSVPVSVGTAQHQCGQELTANKLVGSCKFSFGGIVGIPRRGVLLHLLEFLGDKCWRDSNGASPAIRLDGLNVSNKLLVVCAIVHPVALKESK